MKTKVETGRHTTTVFADGVQVANCSGRRVDVWLVAKGSSTKYWASFDGPTEAREELVAITAAAAACEDFAAWNAFAKEWYQR